LFASRVGADFVGDTRCGDLAIADEVGSHDG